MNRLHQALRRLYLLPAPGHDPDAGPRSGASADSAPQTQHAAAAAVPLQAALLGAEGQTRALVLELGRPADWRALSAVWAGVQADLDLPAPAIAVNGRDGFQLWFSLLQPLPLARARAVLQALQQRYLQDVESGRVRLLPQRGGAAHGQGPAAMEASHALLVPAEQAGGGRWSAFVAPDLAAVMNDEPWLDLPPNAEGQAALLAGLQSVHPADLEKALQALQPEEAAARGGGVPAALEGTAAAQRQPTAALPTTAGDAAHAFLLGVMNDPAAPLALRVEAAKALLLQRC